MKNPLLKHFFSLIRDLSMNPFAAIMYMMLLFVNVSQAQSIAKSECFCLNNATNATNGQYRDVITITTGITGQNWRLVNPISGFYHPASLPPPANPILYLNNTLIPETSPGVYSIEGLRVSGVMWTVKVRNLSNSFEQEVHAIQPCSYPNVTIIGDMNVCMNSSEAYTLPAALYPSLTWSVSSGFTSTSPVLPAMGSTNLNVSWGPTSGRYSLGVSGIVTSYAAQPQGCNFTATKVVDIIDPAPYTDIRGDFGSCIGNSDTYKISATASQLTGVTWGVYTDPAGMISAGIGTVGTVNSRTVQWPNSPGTYYIGVSGSFRINTSSDYCSFNSIKQVSIVNEATTALACNDLVQLSMNPSCELYFTASQFLEAQTYPDASYDIVIRDIERDTIVPNGTLGYGYIGKTLEIKVVHECSGNSCWGYAKIEDKSIPELECPDDITVDCTDISNLNVTGYPVLPIGAIRTPVVGKSNTWILSGYDRCSDVTLTYSDVAETDLCDGPYSSIITRTWKVEDNTKNTSSCVQVISVNRAEIDEVVFPKNWDDATGPNPTLEACGNWPVLPSGHEFAGNPHPDYTGYPTGTICLKSAVTFTDKKIFLCNNNPKTYKLVRKWKVVDHCSGLIEEENQLITVMDITPPVVTCPADLTGQIGGTIIPAAIIYTDEHKCTGTWSVIPPISVFDCSRVTWEVDILLADNTGRPPVNGIYTKNSGSTIVTGTKPAIATNISQTARPYTISNLPQGRTWVRYTITDECGNFSYCFTEIDVVDNQPPTPVCDRNSIIAIGSNSEAYAGVLTFDDGSHDNCKITCMKIRRMDNPVAWTSLECNNQVRFTCTDINAVNPIMIELGVWDAGGLFNSCMVEAKVQDKLFPILTIPSNATANCYEDLTNLSRFGAASVTDNCTAQIVETRVDQLNECRIGTILRTFTATDISGNKTIKTQTITVDNNKKFNGAAEFPVGDIDWPNTITLNASCITDVTPDKLPAGSARPLYRRNTDCAQLAANYEDIIFNFADNVCVKILRKWTVIDWCQKNPFFPGSGEWTYTQLIMLNNTKAPDFIKGCAPADLVITQVDECKANVKVTAEAKDDCTPTENLEWTYTIDEGNDGTIEVTNGSSRVINRDFPYGTHKITWTVKDGCKNPKTCTNVFTIKDDKKPTPYCITELVTVIMPSNKEVTIWASDFDRGATDNCSKGSQITASFSATNRNDISRRITCADLAGDASKEFTYNVYAIDAAGNSDFCTVRLKVQDNGNSCATPNPAQRASIKGNVYNESDEMINNVNLELTSNQTEFPKSISTDVNGKYSFAELPMLKDYTLSADKNDDVLNGISTLDLVLIQRHILGISLLDSPYKLIAADVNNSQKISAADLVELRKLILGIQTEFTSNRSWRFVDIASKFTDPKNPFPFVEKMSMNQLDHDVTGLDFMAVKIGDVNGTAKTNLNGSSEVSNRSVITLYTSAVTAKRGDIVTVEVSADNLKNVLGMQMTFGFDNNKVELVDMTSDAIALKNEHLSFGQLSKGWINLSYNDQEPFSVNEEIVTMKFRILQDVSDLTLVNLMKSGLYPEIYTKDGESIQANNLRLETGLRDKISNEKFELYQNVPNPFNASSVIGFNLPKNDDVTLKIYDVTGKMVYQKRSHFGKGYNTFNVDANTLNLNGVLYYQIDTDTDSATRKMIIIK